MRQIVRRALLLSGLFFVFHPTFAQMKGWETGAWIGVSNYFGDLNTDWRVNRVHFSGGAGARYNFNNRLSMRFGINYAKISAFDSDSKNTYERKRNLHFQSNLLDVSGQFEFNFLPYIHGHRDYYLTPYMFLGPSFYYFNPKAELDGKMYELARYGTEGQFTGEEYNLFQGAIAYGMGFRMDLTYRWSLNIELGARYLFTDYIDDVSGVYADPRDIRAQYGEIAVALADRSVEPKIGLAGRQRGNGKNNDAYVLLNVGLMYYFGQIRCPQLAN